MINCYFLEYKGVKEGVLDYYQTYETRPLYDLINDYFSAQPAFHWLCVGLVLVLLLRLLLIDHNWMRKLPPYGYMLAVLFTVALLDILLQAIPIIIVYLFVLGYVLLRSAGENIYVVTVSYAITFLIIQSLTLWHQLMILELISQLLLFIWISWIAYLVKQLLMKERKMNEKIRYLITKKKEYQKRIHEFNDEMETIHRRDYLTKLYNYGGFQEQMMKSLIRCGENQSYHLIFLDLTDFRQVNMKEGMDVGDQVLIQVAEQLKKHLPPFAQIARFNGDQFAVGIMGDHSVLRRSLEMIEKVMRDLRKERSVLNYCLGIASYPQEASSGGELIRLAENRLTIEQRRLHHKEEERTRHLEKLSAVGQLAAGLAHEIRNPLTSIRGFVQISAAESKEVKKWESIILPEIDRINDLLKQFLNLSESKPARFTKFQLDQLMNDVLSLLQPKSFLMGHELIAEAPSAPIEIEADAEQIKQVLINLIQNGLESLDEKGKVVVRWREFGGLVAIRVQDTGKGINPEHMNRIFDPFFTTKGEGTGMGLNICYRIIDEHRGHIQVTSRPGRGTTFHIYLPLSQDQMPFANGIVPESECDLLEGKEKPDVALHQEEGVR